MINPLLKITDGTISVNLVGNGLHGPVLRAWQPKAPAYAGGGQWQQSAFGGGRQPVHLSYENVIETMDVHIVSDTQPDSIRNMRLLRALLKQASDYWVHRWTTNPVWIEARAGCEPETRYAVIVDGRIDNDGGPFEQPFATTGNVIQSVTIGLEHRGWFDRKPGENGDLITCEEDQCLGHFLVANHTRTSEIDYIYRVSSAESSPNLIGTETYNIMSAAWASQFYLGSPDIFFSAVFNITIPAISTMPFTWEYWNGSAWTTLIVRDNTEQFANAGEQTVHWVAPSNWAKGNLDTISGGATAPTTNAYWIRSRRGTSGTITQDPQQTGPVITVNKSYIDIDGSQIGGDLPAPVRFVIENLSSVETSSQTFTTSTTSDTGWTGDGVLTLGSDIYFTDTDTSTGRRGYVRFTNISIPKSAIIHSARIRLFPKNYTGDRRDLVFAAISIQLADNAAGFTNITDIIARTFLSSSIWSAGGKNYWVDGAGKYTATLASLVQQVVNRSGWASGNAMAFQFASQTDQRAWGRKAGWTSDTDPVLEISWSPGPASASNIAVASRSKDRGEGFINQINLSGDQNPDWVTVTLVNDTTRVASNLSPVGFAARFVEANFSQSMRDRVVVDIEDCPASWYGKYRVILRARAMPTDPGSAFEASPDGAFDRFKISAQMIAGERYSLAEVSPPAHTYYDGGIIDLGVITFDYFGQNGGEGFDLKITLSAAIVLHLSDVYDLTFLPIDECGAEFADRSRLAASRLFDDAQLDIDSVRNPRALVTAKLLDGDDNLIGGWQPRPVREIALRPRIDQRLFFFSSAEPPVVQFPPRLAQVSDVHRVAIYKTQRYQTAIGDDVL